jgi:hypothetical protein
MFLPNYPSFGKFYEKLLTDEQRLIDRRKRMEDSMSSQNTKPPTIDANGRYHAPCDGYQWTDGFSEKSFLGGEYLPVDNFTDENNYYKLSKIPLTKVLDIPYPVAKEMVEKGLSKEGGIIYVKRCNYAHLNKDKVKVITCEITTTEWHYGYLSKFIESYISPLLKRQREIIRYTHGFKRN